MKLADFFKSKEQESRNFLQKKGFFIIRLDGKAFHTFTRNLNKPYDKDFLSWMDETAKFLCSNIQGCKFAYTQSDEISLVLTDLNSDVTQIWFEGNIQKITSVSSSFATAKFNDICPLKNYAFFDSRVFKLDTIEDVNKYLIWRQEDAIKNSITMLSLGYYSHKEIHKKNSKDKLQMIIDKGDNFFSHPKGFRQGRIVKSNKREVSFVNPKTQESGNVFRNIWEVEEAPDFKTNPLVIDFKE